MTPCGRKAVLAVIVEGMPYPLCKRHGVKSVLKKAGMKLRRALAAERCGQSKTAEAAFFESMNLINEGKEGKDVWKRYLEVMREDP